MATCKYCGTENNAHHSASCPVVLVQYEIPITEFPDVQRLISQIVKIQTKNKRLRNALIHIEEYWNKDENPGAMSDALWHILETTEHALKGE